MTAAALFQSWTAYARSLRLWVLELVAWMATVTQWRDLRLLARADLRHLRGEIRFLLVTRMAIALQEGLFAPQRRCVSTSNRHADLFLSRRRFMRFALRRVRLDSLARCLSALDRLEDVAMRCARKAVDGVAVRALHWSAEEQCRAQGMDEVAPAPDTS